MTPQPECATCGATDINYAYAVGNGWRMVLGKTRCRVCSLRFPSWMRRNI